MIVYKGPALATALYGNVALRTFGDLDLLIREKDIARHGLAHRTGL